MVISEFLAFTYCRLDAYKRNACVPKLTDQDVIKYVVNLPDPTAYKDLNTTYKISTITQRDIMEYMCKCYPDIVRVESKLYEDRFVHFVRVAQHGDKVAFKGVCKAEMKKMTVYNVDLVCDSDGIIEEAQCECPAGMGLLGHCKHVAAILLAIVSFCATGSYKSHAMCTEKLQTFHNAKKYTGSPMKASELPINAMKRNKIDSTATSNSSATSNKKKQTSYNFDPKSEGYRHVDNYNAFLKHTVLNYSYLYSVPYILICTLFSPANSYAVDNDHQYFKISLKEHILQTLRITTYDEDYAKQIEIETREQRLSKRWLYERCNRLQASIFGRICKATNRTDFSALAKSLTEVNKISSAPIKHGIK